MATILPSLIDQVNERITKVGRLSEQDMFSSHRQLIWEAEYFEDTPHFYPVYRFENWYSFSNLALILKKQSLNLNNVAAELASREDFFILPASMNIDRDIERLGGPHPISPTINDSDEYAQRIVGALKSDIAVIEARNPGKTNVILCGGRDSLNLLLLPWENPVLILSADPNFEHVCRFVSDNDLGYRVMKLRDPKDTKELDHEILACCSRADLQHWRWGAHLQKISQDLDRQAIFWKGQVADLYMSTTWKSYMHPTKNPEFFLRRAYKKLSQHLPTALSCSVGKYVQPAAISATWSRAAQLQGSHLGFIRELIDCLVLSAYHGPEMIKVWQEADLASVAQTDMRCLVGRLLKGSEVKYPTANPAPPPSTFRKGLSKPEHLVKRLTDLGVTFVN